MIRFNNKLLEWLVAVVLLIIFCLTAPQNHSEAEDVYDFALKVEQGSFAEQAGVNRVLALPIFNAAYKAVQALGYSGRAFPFMIFINRLLAISCLFLFYGLLSYRRHPAGPASYRGRLACSLPDPVSALRPPSSVPILGALCLAFSYGFWRYANEAETYILASVFVLGAWCLVVNQQSAVSSQQSAPCPLTSVLRPLSSVLCPLVSAIGILVHLLNLIPLLLIIPLYYLLSKEWKKGLLHGGLTGLLVIAGYVICSPWLDFSELGAQHHALEGGIGLKNLLRGAIAFGQCLTSGNFLFGFESFREVLTNLFPSRMLDEEFFMATNMTGWISWVGIVTLAVLLCGVIWVLSRKLKGFKKQVFFCPIYIAATVWFVLYALAVIRTEAGSPELWIMALIPFCLLIAPLLSGRTGWVLVAMLFTHNLIAGLLPVMSVESDYHAAKGKWLVDNCVPDDVILTDYEPVFIFYLAYYSEARIINSGKMKLEKIERAIESRTGNAYAMASFFKPMISMRVRNPQSYMIMENTGKVLEPKFAKITDDEFGGIYKLREDLNE